MMNRKETIESICSIGLFFRGFGSILHSCGSSCCFFFCLSILKEPSERGDGHQFTGCLVRQGRIQYQRFDTYFYGVFSKIGKPNVPWFIFCFLSKTHVLTHTKIHKVTCPLLRSCRMPSTCQGPGSDMFCSRAWGCCLDGRFVQFLKHFESLISHYDNIEKTWQIISWTKNITTCFWWDSQKAFGTTTHINQSSRGW